MSYATSNPPALETQAIASTRTWIYKSTDTGATVDNSGYFTNGYDLGMRAGDIVKVYDTTTPAITMHLVITASATAVDLGNGTTVGTATNSD